jgi:hypothetical protein
MDAGIGFAARQAPLEYAKKSSQGLHLAVEVTHLHAPRHVGAEGGAGEECKGNEGS